MKGGITAFQSFETYARGALDQHSLLLRKVVLRHEVDKSIKSLKDENVELRKENQWLAQRIMKLEGDFLRLSQDQDEINDKIDSGGPRSMGYEGSSLILTSLDDEISKLKKDMEDLKQSASGMKINFHDLVINNPTDMHKWLSHHVKSLNYSLMVDLHTIFEFINHCIYPSKSPLHLLQAIKKIDIPTGSHTIVTQSFDQPLPKYLHKPSDHKVTRSTDSLFHNVKSHNKWNEPNYGFRDKLTQVLWTVETAIDNAIREDATLTDVGKSILLNALVYSSQGVDVIVRFIDKTYRELIGSNYTPAKAWHLVTLLITRMFNDIFEPRNGKLNVMQTKNPAQVATVVFHSSFKSLQILKTCRDHEIGKYPNIASEHVKFISHNTPH